MVNAFFAGDIVLNFFLGYQQSPRQGGRWVLRHKMIVKHYARGWFLIDLLTTLPFEQMVCGCFSFDIAKAQALQYADAQEDLARLVESCTGYDLGTFGVAYFPIGRVRKRYSHFLKLWESLGRPGSFPPKRLLWKTDRFLLDRGAALRSWLAEILRSELGELREVQNFIVCA
jgi:hypothetical protein